MHVASTAQLAAPAATVPVADPAPGRHRRLTGGGNRARQTLEVATWIGSLVSLGAIALLCTAIAAGVSDVPAPAERPTVTVTYDVRH
jgi:hypothetical protein